MNRLTDLQTTPAKRPNLHDAIASVRREAAVELRGHALQATDKVVTQGVDAWFWAVIFEDDTNGGIVWGEQHDRRTPVGIKIPAIGVGGIVVDKRIDFAVRVALCHQVGVIDEHGARCTRLVPVAFDG